MKKLLIIIPAYNEENNIESTINKIKNLKIENVIVDYIVINDRSNDNTEKILNDSNISNIKLVNNLGIGAAVQTGYKYAKYNNYDIALQFDGDGQHDEKYIEKIIKPIINNKCDFTIGSRFIGNDSEFKSTVARRIGINYLSFLIKILTRISIKDVTSGFRACNKKIIEIFSKDYPSDFPEPETNILLLKNEFRVIEIPVKMHKRQNGKSSINTLKSIFYMIKVTFAIIVVAISTKEMK